MKVQKKIVIPNEVADLARKMKVVYGRSEGDMFSEGLMYVYILETGAPPEIVNFLREAAKERMKCLATTSDI